MGFAVVEGIINVTHKHFLPCYCFGCNQLVGSNIYIYIYIYKKEFVLVVRQ